MLQQLGVGNGCGYGAEVRIIWCNRFASARMKMKTKMMKNKIKQLTLGTSS